jgi:hypothetical protein
MAPHPPGDDDPSTAPIPDHDVFDYAEYVHDDYGRAGHVAAQFQGDRPGAEQFATGEYPAERFPVAGPLAQNYPAETPYEDDPRLDEPPTPPAPPAPSASVASVASAEDDTDPAGLVPIAAPDHPPLSDPFDDTDYEHDYRGSVYDEFALPGWDSPGAEETARTSRVRRYRRPLVIAGVALFLAGMAAAILIAPRWVGDSDRTEAVGPKGVSSDEVSGPVNGRESALFELVDGAASVRVVAGDLGDDLYRVTTPADSGVTPKVEEADGTLRLLLPPGAEGGAKEVAIVLNNTVRWTLKLDGGTAQTNVDLSGAEVDGVELLGGAGRIDLTLPTPTSVVPVRMTGGVDQWSMRLAGATPVRVRVQSGAGAVTLAGATHRGIAPGQSFTANGWQDGTAGFDVTAVAGMSALTITEG